MPFKRCPGCDCVFGCLQGEKPEIKDKNCYECDEKETCLLYTMEDYKELLEKHENEMVSCFCSNCSQPQKEAMSC